MLTLQAAGWLLVVLWVTYELRRVRKHMETRLAALDDALTEGLQEAEREAAIVRDPVQHFEAQAVNICSQADAVVFALSPSKGFATLTKVGHC